MIPFFEKFEEGVVSGQIKGSGKPVSKRLAEFGPVDLVALVEKSVGRDAADLPLHNACHADATSGPRGLTAPSPVTNTSREESVFDWKLNTVTSSVLRLNARRLQGLSIDGASLKDSIIRFKQ